MRCAVGISASLLACGCLDRVAVPSEADTQEQVGAAAAGGGWRDPVEVIGEREVGWLQDASLDFSQEGSGPELDSGDAGADAEAPGCVPETESCNGLDDDCNGVVDDVLGRGEACSGPNTCGAGVLECGESGLVCSTGPEGSSYAPVEELCNGVDDDCDGEVDEGFGVQAACDVAGVCTGGVVECASPTTVRCSVGPDGSGDLSSDEVCDGRDNDCDGAVDEGVLNACGGCGPEPQEVCNGLDDDCDGLVDEGVLNACGYCGPVPPETCNGVDDDCDGLIDNGLPRFAYFPDCDGDGFGDRGVVPVRDCKPPVSWCDHVQNGDDCDDEDARVKPGQTAYFDTAANGSFDYDCSGAAERELPRTLADCVGHVCLNGYWDTEAPDAPCGVLWPYCTQQNYYCQSCEFGGCRRIVACR